MSEDDDKKKEESEGEDQPRERSDEQTREPFGGEAFDEELFEEEHLFDEAEFEAEGWGIPRDPESVARVLKSLESLVPGILKRDEDEEGVDQSPEGLRARLSKTQLPREAVSFILSQVDTTKREFLRILSREIRLFLEDMDFGGELTKILTSLSFEVRMEVRFIPNDQAFRPSARGKMRVKRTDGAAEKEDGSDSEEEEEGSENSARGRWSVRRRSSKRNPARDGDDPSDEGE